MKIKITVGLVLILSIVGCASTNIKSSASVLLKSQKTIVAAAETIDSLCTAGTLSQNTCSQAASIYKEAQYVYGLAAEAELIYIDASMNGEDTTEAAATRDELLTRFTNLTLDLMEYVDGHRDN